MATATKTYTFAAGTTAVSAEVNKNFDDVLDFLNGGAVIHADGTKAFTEHVSLKDSSPSNALHAASKGYVDNKASSRLIGSQLVTAGVANIGTAPGSATYVAPNITFTTTADDVSSQTKFIFQGEIGPGTYPAGVAFTTCIEVTIDGSTVYNRQVYSDPSFTQTFDFCFRYVPTTASAKTARLRMWQNSGSTKAFNIANGFAPYSGFWGLTRTAP